MGLKELVNAGLTRATGYRLVRAPAANGRAERPAPAPPPSKPAPSRPPKEFPADYDDEAKDVIRAVRPFTMTADDKLYALILATRYVSRHGIPGDIVECGVWRGGSMQAAARTLLAAGDTGRHLYLYDTFEGMPPPSERDARLDGTSAEELMATQPRDSKLWAVATLDDVRGAFSHVGYPEDKVHFVPGKVEETVPAEAPERIAILRLDTDWYESTRHELEHLYPRLSSGGVLLLDDYGWWKGAREATDEFLERTGARLLLLRMASGRIAVKP